MAKETARLKSWWYVLRVLTVTIAGLLLVGLVARAVWVFVTARALQEEIAAIRKLGEPLTFQDLDAADQVQRADDSGRYYQRAVALLEVDDEELRELLASRETWAARWPPAPPEKSSQECLERLFERNEKVFDLIDKAALLPECRYDMRVRQGAHLDEIKGPRTLAGLAWLRTIDEALRGDGSAAVDSVISCLNVGRVFEREPVLMLYLVAQAVRRMACESVSLVLESRPSDAALGKLEAALRGVDRPGRLSESLLAERVYVLLLLRNVLVGTLALNWSEEGSIYGELPVKFSSRPLMQSLAAGYLRDFRGLLRASREPWPEVLRAFEELEVKSRFGALLLAGIVAGLDNTGRFLSLARSARVAVLVERYRRANGRLPESLAELTPAFARQLPTDPYSGKSLLFRSQEGSYVIYGVGSNRQDDGGKMQDEIQEEEVVEPALDLGVRVRFGEEH